MMKLSLRCAFLLFALTTAGVCGLGASPDDGADWKQLLHDRMAEYGHRNWIVIADSAYPAQTNPGIETVVSHADQAAVLREVLSSLQQSKSVRPLFYLDKELKYVDEDSVPGVEAFRTQLMDQLESQNPQTMLHEQLINKLDQVSKTFKVLIIKTNLTIPYTTVFIELRASYWGDDAERAMRVRMSKDAGAKK
jgi:L-fucose mutarotase/ribose pyranase (RbsD/FucU family)